MIFADDHVQATPPSCASSQQSPSAPSLQQSTSWLSLVTQSDYEASMVRVALVVAGLVVLEWTSHEVVVPRALNYYNQNTLMMLPIPVPQQPGPEETWRKISDLCVEFNSDWKFADSSADCSESKKQATGLYFVKKLLKSLGRNDDGDRRTSKTK